MRPIPALLALSALFAALPAAAQTTSSPFEVGLAVSATRENETTPIASVAWLPEWREIGNGMLHWDIGAMYIRGRDGTRFDLEDDVKVFHGGLRYERSKGFVAGFGVGVQSGHTDALSGDPQFVSSIGWRWQRLSLLARHISNASIHQPNDGETMLMATWRFR